MEATARDGGQGPSWGYLRHDHEENGSTTPRSPSSSRSGTIVSTAYTSSASRRSSRISTMESPLLQLEMQRIESLVQAFFHEEQNRSILGGGGGGGGINVLESWFLELGVGWVLQLDVGASVGDPTTPTAADPTRWWSWTLALTQIMETIHLTKSFFPDHGHGSVAGTSKEEVESTSLDPVHLALFFQEAMSKMLVFVDVMFSRSLSIKSLHSCLHIHSALSKALSGIRIRLQFHSSPPAEVEKIDREMVSLLSAKQGKAFEAIWTALEETRARVLSSMEECSLLGTETPPQGSSDIHKATCAVMDLIKLLLRNHLTVAPLVSQAASLGKYVPEAGLGVGEAPPLISLVTEMVSCLEEKLITKSQLFLDKGLGVLFLLNNSNFIREQLKYSFSLKGVDVGAVISFITRKVEHYTESYIQVSWEPMLAFLFNPTPPRLAVRKYSPLFKFESEFQKIYSMQKLWKVPDPELRYWLREAVIDKIIPDYTKYIEDAKVADPKFTPEELEEMLQELFEG